MDGVVMGNSIDKTVGDTSAVTFQKGLAAGIVLPLLSKLTVNIDNIEQLIGDLEEEAVDGMVSLADVEKRLGYFTKLMISNIEETRARVK